MIPLRLFLLCLLVAPVLSACSKNLFRVPEPPCGRSIPRGDVMVLDMTGYKQQPSAIDAAVRAQAGAYQIMTPEPVWIPKRNTSGEADGTGTIASVQSISADWGCNLLILLDTKMARGELKTQARKEERIWLVEAGRRGAPQ
jgi:hypothetical protein